MFTIFTTRTCPYCVQAKDLITQLHYEYIENVLTSPSEVRLLSERIGYPIKTVPQIFHGDRYVGGFDDLKEYIFDLA